jgi:FtsP/CotA-like multicopper oxidase with cupredoxin domain
MSTRQEQYRQDGIDLMWQLVAGRLTQRESVNPGIASTTGPFASFQGLEIGADSGSASAGLTLTPWMAPLPVPPVKQAVPALAGPEPTESPQPALGEARPVDHQGWKLFSAQRFYEQSVVEARHRFHPQLPEDTLWTFDGVFPGPTFHARYGEPILVRRRNALPTDRAGIGIPSCSTHLHNAHTPSESDGYPGYYYNAGQWYDYHYPNIYARCDAFPDTLGDPREALGTLWYHDHRMDFTSHNVCRGMAGFHLLFDEVDSGDETDPNPGALRLPSGDYDVPLMFFDVPLDQNGLVFCDKSSADGIVSDGSSVSVNGAIRPFFEVARRKYRFRFLNAGPSRFYDFVLVRDLASTRLEPFYRIGSDGNLLPRPVLQVHALLSVGERADVVVDFSRYRTGDVLYLVSRLDQTSGRGPSGRLLQRGYPLLKFVVTRNAKDHSQVPGSLRELPTFDPAEAVQTRTWRLERQSGAWAVNGQFLDSNIARATPKVGTSEIWVLQNNSGSWSLPVHIHAGEGFILSRNGVRPPVCERGRKDVYRLGPGEEIRLFIRFSDWTGRYPIHCHGIVHEDRAMTIRFDTVL